MAKRALSHDFDARYRMPRKRQPAARIGEELSSLAIKQLEQLKGRPDRPAALKFFEDELDPLARTRAAEIAATRKPVIGIYCNFPPEELIHAAGAVPVRLCSALTSAVAVAEEALPRDICPVVKSSFGTLVGDVWPASACDAVIVPAACDAKLKLAAALNDYVEVWTVDLPSRRDFESEMPIWLAECKRIKSKIETFVGRPIRDSDLESSIRLYHRRAEVFRELMRVRQAFPHILTGRDMALVTNSSFTADVEQWTAATAALTRELRAKGPRVAAPVGFKPLVLTGSPILWPNWKVLNVIEEAGAMIVADTLCSGTQRLFDPVQVDEWTRDGMLRALALRYFAASLCPCFFDSADLMDRVLELVTDYRAVGVVSHNLRLCQLIDMDTARLRTALRARGIPFLVLQTDLSAEDREQLKTRVEAFLEMIEPPSGGRA